LCFIASKDKELDKQEQISGAATLNHKSSVRFTLIKITRISIALKSLNDAYSQSRGHISTFRK